MESYWTSLGCRKRVCAVRKIRLLFRTQDVHCTTNPKKFWIFQWYLGKGNPLRVSRCIPSGPVSFRMLSPARDRRTFSRSITNRVSVPATPNTPMRTSSRPLHGDEFFESKGRSDPYAILTRKGAVALPFLGTIPSTKGVSLPWNPDQTSDVVMSSSYRSRLDSHFIASLKLVS